MLNNIWKIIVFLIIIIVVYGIIDIYLYQFNIVKDIEDLSSEIMSEGHIQFFGDKIKGKAYDYRSKINIESIDIKHRRLYTHTKDSGGRIPFELEIYMVCRQSFLGLFFIKRSFTVKPVIYLMP